MNKPIVIFTNFWDANKLVDRKHFLFWRGKTLYKIQMNDKPQNYEVVSIALSHPPLSRITKIEEKFNPIKRLDFFCPTYDMLKDYKDGGDWIKYTDKYKTLLKSRKAQVFEWVESLSSDRIYILCCWENTSGASHCHRQLLYDALTKSKALQNQAIYIYRDGSWDDKYVDSELYKLLAILASGKKTKQVPFVVNNPDIAQELGVTLNVQCGTFTSANGSFAMLLNNVNQDILNGLQIPENLLLQGTSAYVDDEWSGDL